MNHECNALMNMCYEDTLWLYTILRMIWILGCPLRLASLSVLMRASLSMLTHRSTIVYWSAEDSPSKERRHNTYSHRKRKACQNTMTRTRTSTTCNVRSILSMWSRDYAVFCTCSKSKAPGRTAQSHRITSSPSIYGYNQHISTLQLSGRSKRKD